MTSEYDKALLSAFVWTQAVEDLVRQCASRCHDAGRIKLCDKMRTALQKLDEAAPPKEGCVFPAAGGPRLHEVLEALEPCLAKGQAARLHALRNDRNHLAHRAGWDLLVQKTAGAFDPDPEGDARFLAGLREVTKRAADLVGELLDHPSLDA